ncbi:class I SAM-dependent methyltransferase [Acrasis kona]|uniref:Class I SAM-dependent methyltransferase n=1 Tax=Acrasis kona TaxID=1008807 RepID=A0AAW2YH20_9EUKA
MNKTNTQYDSIALQYRGLQMDYILELLRPTYVNLIGELEHKRVLDLACGDGYYAKLFCEKGAKGVVAVDISPEMIKLAEDFNGHESIQYVTSDVADLLGKYKEEFQVVTASFLLNYARSKEELTCFLKVIYESLKPGCRFIACNDNIKDDPSQYNEKIQAKYNYKKTLASSKTFRSEGDLITDEFYNDHIRCSITFPWLSPDTYDEALKTVGFSSWEWQDLHYNGSDNERKRYWEDFLLNPPIICFTATK